MPNLLDTATAQLDALGTQVQTLIDQLNAYNIAGAQATATMIQGNISAASAHLRDVAASDTYSQTGGPGGFPPPPPMATTPPEPPPPQEPSVPPTQPPDETDTDPQATATTPGWEDPGEIPPATAKHHKHNKKDD